MKTSMSNTSSSKPVVVKDMTTQAVPWYSDYSFWGNTASIISLIVSIFVFIGVRKIRQNFLFNARAPELTGKLNDIAKKISLLLNDFDQSKEDLRLEVGKCKVTLKTLSAKLEKEHKKAAVKIIKLIDDNAKNMSAMEKDSVYEIYVEIRLFVEQMGNEFKDRQWR